MKNLNSKLIHKKSRNKKSNSVISRIDTKDTTASQVIEKTNIISKISRFSLGIQTLLLIFIISYLFYWQNLNFINNYNLTLLITFLLLFFFLSEVLNPYYGIYATVFVLLTILITSITFPHTLLSNLVLFALISTIVIYYYLLKKLRKKRIEKSAALAKYFKTLANVALHPMIIKNENGEILFASESITELLGYKKSSSIGNDLSVHVHPDDLLIYKKFMDEIKSSPNTKKSAEFRIKKMDEEWIWVRNDAINLLNQPHINSIVASIQDITFQKSIDREKTEILNNEKVARALAEKAVRDRDEFMSIASHELKTPLTTVLLQLQSTLRKISTQSLADFSGGELMNSLQIAEKQSQSLSTLIKDLLNVSLASSGRITLNRERLNLSTLVDSLPKRHEEEIKISGSRVLTQIENKEVIGNWDIVRIDQAITNLLINALKYGKGRDITLGVYSDDKWAYFTIADMGLGIKEDELTEIFEPFKRVNTGNIRGLGVGLYIAKKIATAHRGDIEVESKVGIGSKFTLKLPL